jgi:hypothetical protein
MTAHRLQERKGGAVVASSFSGSARIQLFDQSVEKNSLRHIDLLSRFPHRKEAGSIHFRESLYFSRTRRPLYLERVRGNLEGRLEIAGKRPGMHRLAALLFDAA